MIHEASFGSLQQLLRPSGCMPYARAAMLWAGVETSDVGAVLDGDLDAFIDAYLRWREQKAEAAKQQHLDAAV
jgi:protein subunit release factor B